MMSGSALQGQLQQLGRELIAQRLTWGNAGNMSARFDAENLIITASGTRLGDLKSEDFVICPVTPDPAHQPTRKPSKELPMHRAVYEVRPDAGAVLHAAPPFSTLLACADLPIESGLFVETMYYLERVARVPYYHPGSQALGDAVREGAGSASVLLLENHGVLVFDHTLAEAMMALQTLEAACEMIITARSAGIPLNPLPASVIEDFLTNSGYKPRRRWQ